MKAQASLHIRTNLPHMYTQSIDVNQDSDQNAALQLRWTCSHGCLMEAVVHMQDLS